MDCLFCKIINGTIPAEKVYEDQDVLGFKDITPMASVHLLFIHKKHTRDVNDMADNSPEQIAQIFKAISLHSKEIGIDQTGFRTVTNLGKHGGQAVFHTHFHVLGGERLGKFGF